MSDGLKIIFIFVDGIGIGSNDAERNALMNPRYPTLNKIITEATPVDACLGMEGRPQSATGQATLLTGRNASQAMGRHIEGFPPNRLKEWIAEENLFSSLIKLGKKPTFANSYWTTDPHAIPPRRKSVTTVMTLSALGGARGKKELLSGMAVTHDITRWTMYARGYEGPLISPEEAAKNLCAVGEANDVTLFEHFLTDRAGHSDDPNEVEECLDTLERFLAGALSFADQPNRLFLLCSDHGNLEDNTTRSHTRNPVPLAAYGTGSELFRKATSIQDVTPTILSLYAE